MLLGCETPIPCQEPERGPVELRHGHVLAAGLATPNPAPLQLALGELDHAHRHRVAILAQPDPVVEVVASCAGHRLTGGHQSLAKFVVGRIDAVVEQRRSHTQEERTGIEHEFCGRTGLCRSSESVASPRGLVDGPAFHRQATSRLQQAENEL